MVTVDFLLGIAAGLGLSGVTYLAVWWYQKRQLRRLQASHSPISVPVVELTASPDPEPPPPLVDDPSGPVPEGGPERPVGDRPPMDRAGPDRGRSVPTVAGETVQLSHRVILHLYRQGVIRPEEVPPRTVSQAGMIEALHARQGALAGVLLRLEAAGVVSSETTHVRGGRRRVKVYRLTDRGTELAKELRTGPARRRANSSDR